MTTIKDIAKYAHVSIGTVSNYLTKAKPVSQQKALQFSLCTIFQTMPHKF